MAHFLDPRSDLVFKRIFGEHPEILRNFLNGMLPFADESQFIASLEYLPRGKPRARPKPCLRLRRECKRQALQPRP